MADILTFPGDSRRDRMSGEDPDDTPDGGAALPTTGGRGNEYGVGELARALSLRHRPNRTIIDTLRILARDGGMPLPRTPRVRAGRLVEGPASIHLHSRWDAELVDAWLDNRSGGGSPVAAYGLPAAGIDAELKRRAKAIAGTRA